MGLEEQAEERVVLSYIYPDEITHIDDHSFKISITLEATPQDLEDEISPPPIILTISYPPTYPDTAPDLNLSSPPNPPKKYPYLEISTDRTLLLEQLDGSIEENLGMPMIFTLVSTLKELTESLIQQRQSAARAVKEQAAAKAEEEENEKFHGTAVTRESFLSWRETFVKEMQEAKDQERRRLEAETEGKGKKGGGKAEGEKLTGRQLWERGLVGKGDEEDDDDGDGVGEDGLVRGVEAIKVNQ